MTPTGMNHPYQYLAYFLLLSQDILLSSKEPGKAAKEKLQRDAQLLKDTVLSLAGYWNMDVEAEMKKLYVDKKQALCQTKHVR